MRILKKLHVYATASQNCTISQTVSHGNYIPHSVTWELYPTQCHMGTISHTVSHRNYLFN